MLASVTGTVTGTTEIAITSLTSAYFDTITTATDRVTQPFEDVRLSEHIPSVDINAETGRVQIASSGQPADGAPTGYGEGDETALDPGDNYRSRLQAEAALLSDSSATEDLSDKQHGNAPVVFEDGGRELGNSVDGNGAVGQPSTPTPSESEGVVAGSASGRISTTVVVQLVKDGLASFGNPHGHKKPKYKFTRAGFDTYVFDDRYVVMTDVFGDRITSIVLKRVPAEYTNGPDPFLLTEEHFQIAFFKSIPIEQISVHKGETRAELVDEILLRKQTVAWSDTIARQALGIEQAEGFEQLASALNNTRESLRVALNMLPLGSAVDNVIHGEYGEVALSLVGDAAFFIGGPLVNIAKKSGGVIQAGKVSISATKLKWVAATTEAGVGITRSVQGGIAIGQRPDDRWAAAGYFGEGALRLFGAALHIRTPARVPTSVGQVDELVGSASGASASKGILWYRIYDAFKFGRKKGLPCPGSS